MQDLPPPQRPGRRKSGGGRRLALAAVALAVVAGGLFAGRARLSGGLLGRSREEVLTAPVRRGTLAVVVKEKGALESAKNQDVINEVEGQTTIIMILPEGKRVTKGELVCELDSAALNDTLNNQKITTERAKADFDGATKTHEVAEIAVAEYLKGVFPQDLQTYEGDITLAESTFQRAKDRLAWSDRMKDKKYITIATNLADRSSLLNAEITLKNARRKKLTLEEYTKARQVASLQADVEKAKSDMKAKEEALGLETTKQKKLVRNIEKCKLFAPGDGLIVYANDAGRMGNNQPQVEEGATVRERQRIFSLPDIAHMRVNTKVHESRIDKVAPGLRAKVRVDAFPNEVLNGVVDEVKPMADQVGFFGSDIKNYTTLVSIEQGPAGLRPGMNAQVEILVKELDNVLSVPVQAVIQFQGKDHVYVIAADGQAERREVTVGISSEKFIQVREGLKDGENLALNPGALMTDEEKHEAFGGPAKDAVKAKSWAGGPGGPQADGAGPPDGKGAAVAKGGPAVKGAGKGARGKGQGRGNLPPELREKLQNAGSPEEKKAVIEEYKADHPDFQFAPRGGGGPGGPQGGGGGPGGPGGPGGGPGQ